MYGSSDIHICGPVYALGHLDRQKLLTTICTYIENDAIVPYLYDFSALDFTVTQIHYAKTVQQTRSCVLLLQIMYSMKPVLAKK